MRAVENEGLGRAFARAVLQMRVAGQGDELDISLGGIDRAVARGASARRLVYNDDVAVRGDVFDGSIGGALDGQDIAGQGQLVVLHADVSPVDDGIGVAVVKEFVGMDVNRRVCAGRLISDGTGCCGGLGQQFSLKRGFNLVGDSQA